MNRKSSNTPGQILFRARSVIAVLWVLLLLVFSHPWISVWSVLLFLPGLAIRFWAAGFIGPASRKPSISTAEIVTRGPYSLFRHPLYIGNALLVAAGLTLLRPHWILIALTALGFIVLYIIIARTEERKLEDRYGQAYRDYRKRVTPFFPIRYEGPLFKGFNVRLALREWQTWLVVGVLFMFAFLRTYVIPALIQAWGLSLLSRLSWIKSLAKALFIISS